MGTLRSRAFLRCFYCGRRSNIRFEFQKSFHCSNCDATNWLDQVKQPPTLFPSINGDITDPPAAPESLERNSVQFATPRSSLPRPPSNLIAAGVEADPTFCASCLRNQQMLNSSLAQFEWPDDSTAAEQSARERKYWALRKDLEKRYPQVCEKCLPKVNQKLHQASYKAQTDHLRRMIDRTRSQRITPKKRGVLDAVDFLGRSSWHVGFILHAAWHLIMLSLHLTEPYASTPQDDHWVPVTLGAFHRMIASMLPYSDRLMWWAISLGMCSFPWNPRFKQSIRGFTSHILGFRQWYSYQLLALLVRLVAFSIARYSRAQRLPSSAQLGAQVIIPLLMIQVYSAAKKSIHTDTSPLFRQPAKLAAGLHVASYEQSTANEPNDLGTILDEISHSTSSQQGPATAIPPQQSLIAGLRGDRNPPMPTSHLTNGSVRSSQQELHYDDEMDWSPSASQHRAFSSYNPYKIKNTNPRFSDVPTEPKPGPIWYKVPPAPTNPAQRLRNPPMRPIIRENPKEKENFFQSTGRQLDFGGRSQESSSELHIAPPRFHAPQTKDDPRDGLSNMFANSFSISPSPSPEGKRKRNAGKSGTSDFAAQGDTIVPNRTMTRVVELVALLAALCLWIYALGNEGQYGQGIALVSVCTCLYVSIRLAADLKIDQQIRGRIRPSTLVSLSPQVALVQTIVIILFMWHIWSGISITVSSGVYGNTLFGAIILHHMVHIFT
ncbi:hypothetical protein RRF57_008305 [Xylaria bambusicola]|uniref:Ima1 N-terminal domain-containing protein n=1 Tax=Xylaria bambusicola TaxID=326684 RepID=A0AAN7UV32_9PEZI